MKLSTSMHVHTTYCDGKNNPKELIEEALAKGLKTLGFSGHSTINFEDTSGMSPEGTEAYIKEIKALKKEYQGHIEIALGIEQDYFSEIHRPSYEYVIGSVHSIKDPNTGKQYVVDISLEKLKACADDMFQGRGLDAALLYYDTYKKMIEKIRPTVAGHLDLLTKTNKDSALFSENEPLYQKAALEAAEYAVQSGALIEINTGGMFRGYTQKPYPAPFILKQLALWKAPIIITSDCHKKEALDYLFPEMLLLAKECGFRELHEWQGGGFVPVPIV